MYKIFLMVILCVLTGLTSIASAAVEFDSNSSTTSSTAGTTISWSHTIHRGADRILIVSSATKDSSSSDATISSVKFNGKNLTYVPNSKKRNNYMQTDLYHMLESDLPTDGTYTVSITYNGTVSYRTGAAISLKNVKQQAPEAVATNSGSGTTMSKNITTLTNGAWVVDTVSHKNTGSFTATASGMVKRFDRNSGAHSAAGSTKPVAAAGTTTMSWSFSGNSNYWTHSLAALAPAPAPIGLTAYMNYDRNSLPMISNEPNFTLKVRGGGHYVIADAGKSGFSGALHSDISQPGWSCYYGDNYTKTLRSAAGTIELWISPDFNGVNKGGSGIGSPGTAQELVLVGNSAIWAQGLQIFILNNGYPNDGGQLFAYWKGSDSNSVTFNNSSLQPSGGNKYGTTADWVKGEWHHIAFCWDVNTLGLYLDGGIVKKVARPSKYDGFALGIWIGGHTSDSIRGINSWDGKIDDLGISDTAKYASDYSVPGNVLYAVNSTLLPAQAPNPSDGVTTVPKNGTLSWLPGYYAVRHDVYFDTNFNIVNNATDPNTSPGKGRQTSCNYDPGTLSLGTTYYWRIDEVNSVGGTIKGTVWSFTTSSADLPEGFGILGTVPPDQFNNPVIPSGYTEQAPTTNTTPPTWTQAELNQKYVVFVPNWLTLVYPSTRPFRSQISDDVNIATIAGQYEAASFAIHAMNGVNLSNVAISVTHLTGGSGSDVIETNNIDIRTVRCWPRKVWGQSKYIVTPSFLESHSSVMVNVNTTQQYLATVYVPSNAKTGYYTGTMTITATGLANRDLNIKLQVLPLQLQTPNTLHGMYYDAADVNAGTPYVLLNANRVRNDVINMQTHGMNTIFLSTPPRLQDVYKPTASGNLQVGFDPMYPFGEACQRAGFSNVIYNTSLGDVKSNPEGGYGTIVPAIIHGFADRGWPNTIISYGDEADAAGQAAVTDVINYLNTSRTVAPNTDTYTTIVYPEDLDYFEPNLTMRAFSSYNDDTVVAPTRADGKKVCQYSGTAYYGMDPAGDRLYRGVWTSKLTLDSVMQWVYWHPVIDISQPYQDLFSGATRNNLTCWVFPGKDGPLNSLGWEAMREGIEDEKYLYTLKQKILTANNSGKDYIIAAATDANNYLENLYADVNSSVRPNDNYFPVEIAQGQLNENFYDGFRRSCAQKIQNIANAGVTAYISFDTSFTPDVAIESNFRLRSQGGNSGSHTINTSDGQYNFAGAMYSVPDAFSYYWGDDYTKTYNSTEGTIELWISPDFNGINKGGSGIGGSGSTQDLILAGGTGAAVWAQGLQILIFNNNYPNDGGQLFAYWQDRNGAYVVFNNSSLQPSGGDKYGTTADWVKGQWHHIAFSWDANTLGLYLDGGIVKTANRPSSSDGFGWSLAVGGHTTDGINGVYTWQGKIDDLAIHRERKYTGTYTVPYLPVYYKY